MNVERLDRYYSGGWIAVEDRMPENGQLVWVSCRYYGGDMESIEGIFVDGKLRRMNGIGLMWIANAWMPRYIPSPYC